MLQVSYAFGLFSYFRYQELMKESSRMPLFDLRKLNASLPVPSTPNCPLDILVLGANNDFIVVRSMSIKLLATNSMFAFTFEPSRITFPFHKSYSW